MCHTTSLSLIPAPFCWSEPRTLMLVFKWTSALHTVPNYGPAQGLISVTLAPPISNQVVKPSLCIPHSNTFLAFFLVHLTLKDEGTAFLLNGHNCLHSMAVSHLRRPKSSCTDSLQEVYLLAHILSPWWSCAVMSRCAVCGETQRHRTGSQLAPQAAGGYIPCSRMCIHANWVIITNWRSHQPTNKPLSL